MRAMRRRPGQERDEHSASMSAAAGTASAGENEEAEVFDFTVALRDLPPDVFAMILSHAAVRTPRSVRPRRVPATLDTIGLALSCSTLHCAMHAHWEVAPSVISAHVQLWGERHIALQRAMASAMATAAMDALGELDCRHELGVSYACTRGSPPLHFYDPVLEDRLAPESSSRVLYRTGMAPQKHPLRLNAMRVAAKILKVIESGVSKKAIELWADGCLPARAQTYAYEQEDGHWRWPSTVEDIDPTRRPLALAFGCQQTIFAAEWNPRCMTNEEVEEEDRLHREDEDRECWWSQRDDSEDDDDYDCQNYALQHA